MTATIIIAFLIAYIAGSINFSIFLFKALGKSDPREKFSGNPGVTNVRRQAGLMWASVVLSLDMGRALLTCYLSLRYLDLVFLPWVGLFLILGNRYPCFHKFKGGKGVANFLGFTAYFVPLAAIAASAGWVVTYLMTKKPFIGSFVMIAVLSAGTIMKLEDYPIAYAGTITSFLFIFVN